jgi:hypothetical protein
MDVILVLNAGSSSIKFALFDRHVPGSAEAKGERFAADRRIGDTPRFKARTPDGRVAATMRPTWAPALRPSPHERAILTLLASSSGSIPRWRSWRSATVWCMAAPISPSPCRWTRRR